MRIRLHETAIMMAILSSTLAMATAIEAVGGGEAAWQSMPGDGDVMMALKGDAPSAKGRGRQLALTMSLPQMLAWPCRGPAMSAADNAKGHRQVRQHLRKAHVDAVPSRLQTPADADSQRGRVPA